VLRRSVSYVLQAFVVHGSANLPLPAAQLPFGYVLHPLHSRIRVSLGIPACPLTDDARQPPPIPDALMAAGLRCSKGSRVAYIEAESFGGHGLQASIVWEHGTTIRPLEVAIRGPVNAALELLGVPRAGTDEFDALELSRYRHTDDWPIVHDTPSPRA
jgi:hypothetical protein